MSGIQRWHDNGEYVTTNDEGEYVTYADHLAAVARITSFAVKQIMSEEEDTRRDLLAAYEQGQRDALAAAVQRVEALGEWDDDLWRDHVIAAITGEAE